MEMSGMNDPITSRRLSENGDQNINNMQRTLWSKLASKTRYGLLASEDFTLVNIEEAEY